MNFRERIDILLKALHISRAEFERLCGLSNGYTRNLGGMPGSDKLEKILTAFPTIRREWLLTGEGEMLCPQFNLKNVSGSSMVGENTVNNNVTSEFIDLLKKKDEQIEKKDEQIDRLLSMLEKLTNK